MSRKGITNRERTFATPNFYRLHSDLRNLAFRMDLFAVFHVPGAPGILRSINGSQRDSLAPDPVSGPGGNLAAFCAGRCAMRRCSVPAKRRRFPTRSCANRWTESCFFRSGRVSTTRSRGGWPGIIALLYWFQADVGQLAAGSLLVGQIAGGLACPFMMIGAAGALSGGITERFTVKALRRNFSFKPARLGLGALV